jgi:hypothetical protein
MTPFQQALISASEGKLKTPTVSTSTGNVDYFGYQLAVHKYNLSIMAAGMQCRGITFTQIKKYYGLKGRTAKDCLGQMDQLISAYKQALNGYGDESVAETMDMNSRMN